MASSAAVYKKYAKAAALAGAARKRHPGAGKAHHECDVGAAKERGTHISSVMYRATVSCIGDEPKLEIDGLGEFRFAYRNVKKQPGVGKPLLNVGDFVECRLTATSSPTKAVSVRLVRGTVATKRGAKLRQPAPVESPLSPLSPRLAGFRNGLGGCETDGGSSESETNSASASASCEESAPSVYSHDPYSSSGVRYFSGPVLSTVPTPMSSMPSGSFDDKGLLLLAGLDIAH